MNGLTIRAHAKINLTLRVFGRRPDAYHDLHTVVQSISLHDTIQIEAASSGVALEVDDPRIPADSSNLVWRAASRLGPPQRSSRGLRIRLRKRIPAGAGLGGGSSDAAATLVALNRLWGLGHPVESLARIAAELGSDVPFFLAGGTALLTGRGTEVRRLPDCLGYTLLVVYPGVPLSTGEVYSRFAAPLTPDANPAKISGFEPIPNGEAESWVRLGNDLGAAARGLCPAIGAIEERLKGCGASAAGMTGSGSAVFGIFRDDAARARAARLIEDSGWTAWHCEPLGRAAYCKSLGLD